MQYKFVKIPYLSVVFVICFAVAISYSNAYGFDDSQRVIATDSRIKTFVYSENEVFPVILHYGYQTSIEFGEDEYIRTYSIGNSYAWHLNNVGRTLFIKPLEENILTNMTIITNKRRYYLELQSKMMMNAADQELAYAIRFFYPGEDPEDQFIPKTGGEYSGNFEVSEDEYDVNDEGGAGIIKPYNFKYKVEENSSRNAPDFVFDNDVSTFFYYKTNTLDKIPHIKILDKDKKRQKFNVKQVGHYLIVNIIAKNFELVFDKKDIIKVSAIEVR